MPRPNSAWPRRQTPARTSRRRRSRELPRGSAPKRGRGPWWSVRGANRDTARGRRPRSAAHRIRPRRSPAPWRGAARRACFQEPARRRRDGRLPEPGAPEQRAGRRQARCRPVAGGPSERCLFLLRLFPLAPVAKVLAGFLVDLAHAELDLAAVIEAEDLDLDRVADLDDVGHLADALRRQLADMDEAVARAQEVHESAEIDDLDHFAVVDRVG